MKSEKKKIPAYLVKENYQGRRRRLRGEIVSLNEADQTADMVVEGKLYKDVPSAKIVVNEAFVHDLKALRKSDKPENKKIQAYLVKENYQGRKIRVKGEIVSLNEADQTADMIMMGKLYKDIPASNIVINEAFMDDLKAMGKKVGKKVSDVKNVVVDKAKDFWAKALTSIEKVKGKLVALFNGQVRANSPLLIAQQMKKQPGFGIWLPESEKALAEENGISIPEYDVDEVIQDNPEDLEELNNFLRIFADNYKNSEMTLEESWGSENAKIKRIEDAWGKAIRMVEFNECLQTGHWPLYPPSPKWSRRETLNEATKSKASKLSASELSKYTEGDEAVNKGGAAYVAKVKNISLNNVSKIIISNLREMIISGEFVPDSLPICIWGPPGVGKTVALKNIVKSMQRISSKILDKIDTESTEENNAAKIAELEQEIKNIKRAGGGYMSKKREAEVENLQTQIDGLKHQKVSGTNRLLNITDDDIDIIDTIEGAEKAFTTDAGWGSDIIMNPALIYITCNGMTKDSFSLPSFSNDEELDDKTKEDKIQSLEKKFGGQINVRTKVKNNPQMLSALDRSMASKTVLEIPKSWLPMYMPTGDKEIDLMLDEETYTMRGMVGAELYNCGVLFIDELARVQADVMNILMILIQARTYEKSWRLGRKWYIAFASNRVGDMDKEIVNKFSWENAFGRRMQHYNVIPKKEEWIEWARSTNPVTGRPNIEIDWIIQLIEQDKSDRIWLSLNDINPETGKNETGGKGIRLTGGANPASWERVSQKLAYLNLFKDMYNDPDGFRYPNGEPLNKKQLWAIKKLKAQGELPPELAGYVKNSRNVDKENVDDILMVVQSIIGTDQEIEDAIRELFNYKSFWTPARCKEVCKNGKTSDPKDNTADPLPMWKRNLDYVREIFELILAEANELLGDPEKAIVEIKDLAVKWICDDSFRGKWDQTSGAWASGVMKDAAEDKNFDWSAIRSGKSWAPKNPFDPAIIYYIIDKFLIKDTKAMTSKINKVYNNIINYAVLVSEQKAENAGSKDINTQFLSELLGDPANGYQNGLLYNVLQSWFIKPAQSASQQIDFSNIDLQGTSEDDVRDKIIDLMSNLISRYASEFVWRRPKNIYDEVANQSKLEL